MQGVGEYYSRMRQLMLEEQSRAAAPVRASVGRQMADLADLADKASRKLMRNIDDETLMQWVTADPIRNDAVDAFVYSVGCISPKKRRPVINTDAGIMDALKSMAVNVARKAVDNYLPVGVQRSDVSGIERANNLPRPIRGGAVRTPPEPKRLHGVMTIAPMGGFYSSGVIYGAMPKD